MENQKPPKDPDHLLDDLESIHELLGESGNEPPLLTESFEPDSIPLLSDVVTPAPRPPQPAAEALDDDLSVEPPLLTIPAPGFDSEQTRLDSELRDAARTLLQDVIDEFVPQIEAELQRRLEARLQWILTKREP
ncbi:hypothetical protein D3C81_1293600 [compost metagenome]